MIEQPLPNQPAAPLEEPPQPPLPNKPHKKTVFIIAGFLTVAILITGLYFARSIQSPEQEPEAVAIPTQTPTPTLSPNLSRIATSSAFATFSEEIASLAATLNAFSLQDTTLAPPILDLELGL